MIYVYIYIFILCVYKYTAGKAGGPKSQTHSIWTIHSQFNGHGIHGPLFCASSTPEKCLPPSFNNPAKSNSFIPWGMLQGYQNHNKRKHVIIIYIYIKSLETKEISFLFLIIWIDGWVRAFIVPSHSRTFGLEVPLADWTSPWQQQNFWGYGCASWCLRAQKDAKCIQMPTQRQEFPNPGMEKKAIRDDSNHLSLSKRTKSPSMSKPFQTRLWGV